MRPRRSTAIVTKKPRLRRTALCPVGNCRAVRMFHTDHGATGAIGPILPIRLRIQWTYRQNRLLSHRLIRNIGIKHTGATTAARDPGDTSATSWQRASMAEPGICSILRGQPNGTAEAVKRGRVLATVRHTDMKMFRMRTAIRERSISKKAERFPQPIRPSTVIAPVQRQ